MKKVLFSIVCIFVGAFVLNAQPTLLEHVTFENGMPTGWTASSNQNVVIDQDIHSTGAKSLWMKPSNSGSVILTSPVYNVTPGHNVRIEMSHLPVIKNSNYGAYIEVKTSSNSEWQILNDGGTRNAPQDFDRTYGGNEGNFAGLFYTFYYWKDFGNVSIPKANMMTYLYDTSNYYYNKFTWKHAVFYLSNFLTTSDNSFQIRFVIPQTPTSDNATGWFLDDIRLFEASIPNEDIRVPQITEVISVPKNYNHPSCSDVEVLLKIQDRNGSLSNVADSLYVEYYVQTSPENIRKVNLTNVANAEYSALIPFAGVDSVICWRVVINDHKNNRLTYPFPYGTYFKTKTVIPYVGDTTITQTGTSNDEMIFKTGSNVLGAKYQTRYKASELLAAGFGPGVIQGLSVKVTQANAAGALLPNFRLRLGTIAPTDTVDVQNPYSTGVNEVYSNPNLALPGEGWFYFPFYPDQYLTWDGISDLIITSCYDASSAVSSSTTKIECIPAPSGVITKKVELGSGGYQEACVTQWPPNESTMSKRPNFKFNFVDICFFEHDAGISRDSIISPANAATCDSMVATTGYCIEGQNYPLTIKLKNYGTSPLDTVKVYYMLDNNTNNIQSATWTGFLDTNATTNFTLTNTFSPTAGQHTLTVWTALDYNENIIDWNLRNDTAHFNIIVSQGQMNGVYAIGGTVAGVPANRTYRTFNDAFFMMINSGVNGPVTFKVKADTVPYTNTLTFPRCVPGVNASNTVTFESADTSNRVKFATIDYDNNDNIIATTQPTFILDGVKYFKLKNFDIKPTDATTLIKFSNLSENVDLVGLRFTNFTSPINTYNSNPTASYINVGAANNIRIDSCEFNFKSADSHPRAVFIKGLSPVNPNTGVKILNSTFNIGTRTVIYVEYNTNTTIKGNTFVNGFDDANYVNLSEARYVVTAMNTQRLNFEANRVVLKGMSAISLSEVSNSRVVNNQISINNFSEQPIAAYLSYGLNLVSGTNDTIAFNNVYGKSLYAYDRRVVGMSLGADGQTTANNIFKNNMMVSDGHGFAVVVKPTDAENCSASFAFSHNMYYKTTSVLGMPLLSYNGATNTTEESWQLQTGETNSSYTRDPVFISWDNLYTTVVYPCGRGVGINNITKDFYGHSRPTNSNPCIGAREYAAPRSNIHVLSTGLTAGTFDGDKTYSSCFFGNDSVFVTFINLSNDTIQAGSGKFKYKVDNNSVVSYTYPNPIIPDSIYTAVITTPFNFSTTTADIYFTLKTWSDVVADTINDNDTAWAYVNSFAQLPALAPMSVNIDYGATATLNVTSQDSIYWYYHLTDEEPFLKSHTYVTESLVHDTAFYFSRKSEIPVLRITEIQFISASTGITDPMPDWATSANNVYEISNLGTGAVNMTGYKFAYVRAVRPGTPSSAALLSNSMTKTYTFPNNFILQPNTSVWLVNKTGTSTEDNVFYIGSAAGVIDTNAAGFLLKSNTDSILDAVTINYSNFNNNTHVPATVWSGYVITPTTTQQISGTTPTTHIAGIIRTNANGTNASAWTSSSATNPMTIGTYNDNLTVYVANDCYGDKTTFNVIINDPPVNEIALTNIKLANGLETETCGLTNVSFTIEMVNMGAYATTTPIPLVAKLYEGGTMISTFTDNYTPSLSTDTVEYTLNGSFDVSANTQTRNLTVVIYSNLAADTINYNDTVSLSFTSLQTPLPPVTQDVNIAYASSTTLTANAGNNRLIWYSDLTSDVPLAMGDYTTPTLYETTTYYVEALQRESQTVVVGNGTSTTGSSATTQDPGPFNARKQHVKEQYLYKADDLIAAGLEAGNINSIAFNISGVTLGSGQQSANLQNYNLRIGSTNTNALSTWVTGLTEVYSSSSMSFTSANTGWRTMEFDTPFVWDGTSNIVVEVCFETSVTSNTVKTYFGSKTYNCQISYKDATNNACSWTGAISGSAQKKLPNIRFGVDVFGCNSARSPLTVNVDDAPNCELALSGFVSPEGSTVESGISTPISVVLHNNGSAALTAATIELYLGNVATPSTSYSWTGNLASGDSTTVIIDNHTFTPGALTLTAVVVKDCDNIHSNDTIRLPINICVGNSSSATTYTIAANSPTADYSSISAAIQDLAVSGVCGPIVFNVANGNYTERFTIPSIQGVSEENTITFQAANTLAMPKINVNTTEGILLDNAEYIIFKNIEFKTSGNITLMDINNSNNISFEGVKFTTTGTTTTLVNLRGKNTDIEFLNDSLYGGKVQLTSALITESNESSGLSVNSCWFWGASSNSIAIASYDNVQIVKNTIRQQASTEFGKAISFRKVAGDSRIEGNNIYMVNGTKVRQGIEVKASNFTAISPLMVFNNSISIKGTTSSGINSLGIEVDTSSYVSLYFNTVNMASSTNSPSSMSLKVGKGSSNVIVRNNNLDNSAKGFAYYVEKINTVSISNNNNYAVNGAKFAYWAANIADLTALKAANNMDASSFAVANPFTNDSILSILYPTDIANAGVTIEGISKDILNHNRPIAPGPTIGAYELLRNDYDAGVTEINIPLSTTDYIEGDQIPVSVRIKNFGNYSITSLNIVAKLKHHQEDATPIATLSETFTGMLTSMDEVDFNFTGTFTAELNDPINDPFYLEVYTIIEDDEDPLNDTSNVAVKVIPAYNLQLVKTENITERCKLFDQPITVQIKNVGVKAIHSTDTVYVTYEVENRPDMSITEQIHLPYNYNGISYDSIQHNVQIGYTFAQTANFYPLGTSDTTWKVRSYITFAKDHLQTNDTSNFITINSRISPPAPIALNDTIFYGTIGHPSATQTGHLAIKWFTDSLQADPFYTATYSNSLGGYAPYTTADRVFADSIYYTRVNLTGTYPCESFYTEVKVVVKDRQPVDMAALRVTAPLHTLTTTFNWAGGLNSGSHLDQELTTNEGSVYMEEDTVKFLIVNYGNQPATGFNINYSIATSTTAEPTIVTETCNATILPDQQYVYSFTTLADVSDPSKTYRIRAWVDADGDATPLNDTSDYRLVKPRNGSTQYPTPTVTEASSMDITRVQFANLDNTTIAGDDTYSNFTQTVEPAILFKGITDTLIVQHQNASSMEAGLFHSGWMKVYIDWNRNGAFEGDDSVVFYTNHYPNWELVYSDTVMKTEMTNIIPITVPTNVIGGKTRMRIILSQEDSKHEFSAGYDNMSISKGEIEDYLLNILPMEDNNAQLLRFTSPSEVFQTTEQQTIKVMMKNAGHNTMTSANIHWFINDEEQTPFNWSGSLSTSHTEEVTLGTINAGYGSTSFRAYVQLPGDTYNLDDTVAANIFRFKTYDITYTEDFDDQLVLNDDFYAYEINVTKPSNCWELGIPNADSNSKITEAYSYPYCWKTNLDGKYPKNNTSILYTPVFNIELIKPDTLAFMLYRAMGSATMTVEYMDYQGQWQIISGDTLEGVPYGQRWYGGQNGFTGTSNTGWTRVAYSLDHLLTNMGTKAQFRFIFTSGSGTTSDGVAIDDFQLFKGLRDQDAGVTYVELAPSILPNYGQLFYPKVTVHNYGRGILSSYRVCYMSEDMHIPTCEDVSYAENGIAPGGDTIYTFQTGHYLDVAMPDPFSIVSFTRLNPVDLYTENDTARANIVIGPLQKDAAIIAIEQPTEQIVSNDDVEIAIRIRNYGLEPITQLPVSYFITGSTQVDEVINFNPPLYNGDEYIYRFNQRYHASYGSVNLKVWSSLEGDYYHDNDTLYKRLQGSSYTQDIEARYITIDDRDPNTIGIQLAFLNRSSIGIGDITVGYYYDGNINNKVEETYRLGSILPAGTYGYHYFTQKLPRRVYQSICAYVVVPNEVNLSNDTTCTLMIGYTDGFADTIFIEETVAEDCLVQLIGHNNGTLGGNTMVTAHYVINGDWANVVTQTFNWEFDEPNPNIRQYMTFSNRIPKSENGQYDIVAWLDYPNDWHHWNDTTRIYQVKSFVGLEDVVANESGFVLEQNVPNPYDKQTDITFTIPQSDNVKFYITNTIGQVVYSQSDYYQSGKHTIHFDSKDLPEGVYYYTMEYRKEKQVRKMIIVR